MRILTLALASASRMPMDKSYCFFASILDIRETERAGDDCFEDIDLELLFDDHFCHKPLELPSSRGGYATHMVKATLPQKMMSGSAAEVRPLSDKQHLPKFVARVIPQGRTPIARAPQTPAQFEADDERDLRALREDFESAERMQRIPRSADTAYNPSLDDDECGSGSDDELKRLFDGLRIRHLLESGGKQASTEQPQTAMIDRSSVKRNRRG